MCNNDNNEQLKYIFQIITMRFILRWAKSVLHFVGKVRSRQGESVHGAGSERTVDDQCAECRRRVFDDRSAADHFLRESGISIGGRVARAGAIKAGTPARLQSGFLSTRFRLHNEVVKFVPLMTTGPNSGNWCLRASGYSDLPWR